MAMYDNLLANVPTDLWIGGKWRKSSDGGRFDVIDPATENKVASVASATIEDARAALDAASGAFAAWAGKKPRERAEVLRKSYELIMRDAERLAKLITIENGKALSDSRGEVAYAAEFFRWYAEEAVRNIGQNSVAPSSGARILVHHKPAGVAVLVTPWNFPAAMATRKIGPALAAGCTVVLKPASDTPLTMLALMVPRALAAAEKLKSEHGIDCEVVDVRSLVPLDTQTILGSVARTHRLFTVEENPRLCGWGAEIVSIVADEAFYDLDGPPVRITTPHIPLPAADILEDLALPSVERIVDRVKRAMES